MEQDKKEQETILLNITTLIWKHAPATRQALFEKYPDITILDFDTAIAALLTAKIAVEDDIHRLSLSPDVCTFMKQVEMIKQKKS